MNRSARSRCVFAASLVTLSLLAPAVLAQSMSPTAPSSAQALKTANQKFEAKLLREAVRANPRGNVLISPISAAQALQMLYSGASGETQQAMARVLALEGMDLDALRAANRDLLTRLSGSKTVSFLSANALWLAPQFPARFSFVQGARDGFGAEVRPLEGVGPINAWVAQKTQGKITQLFDRLPDNTVMALVNATYFKGGWQKPFDKKNTAAKPFTLQNGSVKTVQMMSARLEKVDYVDAPTYEGVRLNYRSDGGKSFVTELFLPKRTSSLLSFTYRYTSGATRSLNWEKATGTLELPRFKMESRTDLKALLARMGMGEAFEPARADFAGISDQKTYVSDALQKATLEVNEEGAEASAATGALISVTSVQPEPRSFNLILNRPFFMTIRELSTDTTLFMGAVYEPDSK